MAKTFKNPFIESFWADTAMSASQYYCVTGASVADTVKIATGASDPYPIGVLQDDSACAAGDAVAVALFGPTKARVIAATTAGTACDIDFGHRLACGTDGQLYYAPTSCLANAVALDFLDSGSAIINVWFLGPGGACALAAI